MPKKKIGEIFMTKDVLHYDTVGSFLRPEKLKQARQEFLENKISRENHF